MTDAPAFTIELEEDRAREGAGGRYVIHFPGGLEAELTFIRGRDKVMVIDHTLVPPALEGRGIAAALVARVVSDARAQGFKIEPVCSYVVAAFQRRNTEWADVRA